MNIIYKYKGGDLCIEHNARYSPQIGWKFKAYGKAFVIDSITVDFDDVNQKLIVDVLEQTETANKTVKNVLCVQVWEQCFNRLTKDKYYGIIQEDETYFYIFDDNGERRRFKHNNSQFKIIPS